MVIISTTFYSFSVPLQFQDKLRQSRDLYPWRAGTKKPRNCKNIFKDKFNRLTLKRTDEGNWFIFYCFYLFKPPGDISKMKKLLYATKKVMLVICLPMWCFIFCFIFRVQKKAVLLSFGGENTKSCICIGEGGGVETRNPVKLYKGNL